MPQVSYDYDWYRSLLDRCRQAGFQFRQFDDGVVDGGIYLRHDVDWSPQKALAKAEIEADEGVHSTYFFLITSPFYNVLEASSVETVRQISSLGHDIGLHFDSNAYFTTEPDQAAVQDQVTDDRSVLASRIEDLVDIVAFHNPPDWVLHKQFAEISHTYEPQFFSDVTYRSDSLGRWREEPPFSSGFDDIRTVQLLTHPTLWGDSDRSPADCIKEAYQENVARADEAMRTYSRLDWD